MRIYPASSEEALRAQKLLKDWAGEGFLSKAQYQILKEETVTDLRTTNIFFRLVLFLFALISLVAAAVLFFLVSRPSEQGAGVFLLAYAAISYACAEVAVSQGKLYRYGIEEALAVCSVGFLCTGIQAAFFSGSAYSPKPVAALSLVPAAGVVLSIWIWRRFGFSYAFLAAMIFVLFVPGYWTSSPALQRGIIAGFYATGLTVVARVRSRHRFDYLDEVYSIVEAFLWLGIYLVFNLQVSLWKLPAQWWGGTQAASGFVRPFYWGTWVLIWCLPPIVIARGVRQKDRFVIAVGAAIAVLTLASNKLYLGWPRHTWDPMLLGIVLTGVALLVRRWLARGQGGIFHGFTAIRLSGRDKQWMDIGQTVVAPVVPHSITPEGQASGLNFRFGGGRSGGGGAGGEF